MNIAEWMINPRNGKYLGHAEVNGVHIYSSGRNLSKLQQNMRQQAWTYHLPYSSVILSLKPTNDIDFSHASPMFMSKSVFMEDPRLMKLSEAKRIAKENKEKQPKLHEDNVCDKDVPVETTPQREYKHISRIENGQLVVYRVEEVCRYDLMQDQCTDVVRCVGKVDE